ncbi:MAG: hypothetical protein LBJ73_03000 [Rickettsiales bacterium]|nr:hypothetical protein [Rickettsiales bacterium]
MKYNIILLSNQDIFWMLDIMLHSIHLNCDTDFINKIFIADIGLNEKSRRKISKYKLVEFIDTGININGGNGPVHSAEWSGAVWQKTRYIQHVLERTDLPLIYSDIDTIVCRDFASFIDPEFDFQITRRVAPASFSGFVARYISSFFIFNNHEKSLEMLDAIRAHMKMLQDSGQKPPYETQALNQIDLSGWNVGYLWDEHISCDNDYVENSTCIIHYKSNQFCRDNTLLRLFLIYLRRTDVVRKNIPRRYWRLLRQCAVNPPWARTIKI